MVAAAAVVVRYYSLRLQSARVVVRRCEGRAFPHFKGGFLPHRAQHLVVLRSAHSWYFRFEICIRLGFVF
jgi:hypothetical protein